MRWTYAIIVVLIIVVVAAGYYFTSSPKTSTITVSNNQSGGNGESDGSSGYTGSPGILVGDAIKNLPFKKQNPHIITSLK